MLIDDIIWTYSLSLKELLPAFGPLLKFILAITDFVEIKFEPGSSERPVDGPPLLGKRRTIERDRLSEFIQSLKMNVLVIWEHDVEDLTRRIFAAAIIHEIPRNILILRPKELRGEYAIVGRAKRFDVYEVAAVVADNPASFLIAVLEWSSIEFPGFARAAGVDQKERENLASGSRQSANPV